MLPDRTTHTARPLFRSLGLPLSLLVGFAACTTAPLPVGTAEPMAEPAGEVVRLTSAEAERLARETREQVSVTLAPGLAIDLWAPEQLLIDPIALDVDPASGAVFVTGSTRSGGLMDIRSHPTWPIEALRLTTVEEYRAFIRRELAPERSEQNQWLPDFNEDGVRDWRDLTVLRERVYRLLDTNGDGRADLSQIVMEGFDDELTDVAGALALHGRDMYVGAAPDLWRMRDTTGNGLVDVREVISHGYGTHPGFNGHGISGTMIGPDGRLYWSVGDMGFDITDREGRRWSYPNQGAIFRAEPDGSGFEVFAIGLRNTHEFAFDEFGNLISVDNDGDHPGEHERLVYLVDGSDSGWRVNWQFGKYTDPTNNSYRVWMDEGLYRPRFEGQAAYIVPPLAAYHNGPTGMIYNPGTALGERWRNHFFVSEFVGASARSRIHAFQLQPQGAGFQLARDTVVLSGLLTTGMRFGPDGALYLADWVSGWSSTGTGRVWRLDEPDAAASPIRAETRALLAENFARRRDADLSRLLRHADMRVRQKAQFALVERSAARTLLGAARQREHQLARVHGLWGIGQLARRDGAQAAPLVGLLRDADPEVRAQSAKVLGDVRYQPAANALLPLLQDESPRVRFFAAEALGRIGHAPAVPQLVQMLAQNDGADVYLRHAGSLALARIGDATALTGLADHPSRAVRVAAVVALRRMQDPGVTRFLADRDEYVATEAARAINDDGGIEAAMPELARVLDDTRFTGESLLRRAINANLRLGTPEAARRVSGFAMRAGAPEALRAEAITALGVWPEPSTLDRVDGMYHGPTTRDPAGARMAVAPLVQPLLGADGVALKVALAEALGRLQMTDAVPALRTRLERDPSADVRLAALNALHVLQPERMEPVVRTALADGDARVRMRALGLVHALDVPEATAVELLATVLGRGTVAEQQSALQALGALRSPHAERVLGRQVDQLIAGQLAPELQLEVIEAVEAGSARALRTRLAQFRDSRAQGNATAAYFDALHGGSVQRGRQVVFQHVGGQCTRCHVVEGRGSDVGPNLAGVGSRLSREVLLEALVEPNARITPGYGIVTVTLRTGERLTGTLQEESPSHLAVQTAAGESRRIAVADVAERINAPSGMPPMGHILNRRELRDVVEYLSTLR